MNGVIVRTPAKNRLIHFINEAKLDEDYSFVIEGGVSKAEAFVQQMRVELSRFRNILKKHGKEPRNFKVLTIAIDEFLDDDTGATKCRVTLRQSMAGHVRIEEQYSEILSKLSKPSTGNNT